MYSSSFRCAPQTCFQYTHTKSSIYAEGKLIGSDRTNAQEELQQR